MALIKYANIKLGPQRVALIEQATAICEEYAAAGLVLTLRQVYYQFVARGLLPNKQSEYKRLGEALNDGRMAGLFDWDFLIDRTRNLVKQSAWRDPRQAIDSIARQYHTDLWRGQHERVEVWIEKDAGIGVIEGVCEHNDVPYFSCRGYTSASEMWAAAQRIGDKIRRGDRVTILHIGDHDPSGVDMTRDIGDRLATFVLNDWHKEFKHTYVGSSSDAIRRSMRDGMRQLGSAIGDNQAPFRVKRIALNMDQIEQYDPPPNPTKMTDSRSDSYGYEESWELDALDPFVLQDLINDEVEAIRHEDRWDRANAQQEKDRATLQTVAARWAEVVDQYAPNQTQES